jgi:hypothetical protein
MDEQGVDDNMMIDLPSKQTKEQVIPGEIASKDEVIRLRREEIERNIAKRSAQIQGVQKIFGSKPSIEDCMIYLKGKKVLVKEENKVMQGFQNTPMKIHRCRP